MKQFSRTLASLVVILVSATPAWAAEGATGGITDFQAISAGFAMAIAAALGTYSQGRVARAALESIGRNPGASGQMFLPLILGLAFVESLVIFVMVVALILTGFI